MWQARVMCQLFDGSLLRPLRTALALRGCPVAYPYALHCQLLLLQAWSRFLSVIEDEYCDAHSVI